MDIATAFFADVPQDPKDPRIKAKMDKVNTVLEKLTSRGGFFFVFLNQYSHTAYTMASLLGYVRQPKGLKTARGYVYT